jgi:peptidoglycan/LPS O-acetylase OafA/YrhL
MTYRPDVDGLRALAVLAVVGFHAFPGAVPGGFIGVDVFFVISGFLITGIMVDAAAAGRFSLSGFYARRIRRIFPALIVVLAACYAAGWLWLFEDRFAQLGKHVAGGAGFASNFLLWQEAGYFDASGETKPLLHLWSLGIEEQFYLAWPLIVYVAWRTRVSVLVVAAVAAAASLAFNLYSIRQDLVGTFYSPATRAWELMTGSLLACAVRPALLANWPGVRGAFERLTAGQGRRDLLSVAGLLAVAGAMMGLNGARHYPGAWAMIPVAGAALLIAAGPGAVINRAALSASPMVWLGLVSYPLYLWHWPLLAFARIWQAGEPPVLVRMGAVTLALVLAVITYRALERPIRFGAWRGGVVPALSAAMAVLLLVGWQTYQRDGFPMRAINLTDRAHFTKYYEAIKRQEMPAAYREECDFMDWRNEATKDTIAAACTEPGSRRTMLLWGDSFAQALSTGIRSLLPADTRLAQVTTSHCQASVDGRDFGVPGGRCARANAFALSAVRTLRPEVVVVAQRAEHELTDWNAFAAEVRAAGAGRVVLVGPSPQWLPSLPAIVVSHFWPQPPTLIAEGLDRNAQESDRALQSRYRDSADLQYVSLMNALCEPGGCRAVVPGTTPAELITFDMGHLTPRGSTYVAGLVLRAPLLGR